jgi:hypothetical protein
MIVLHQPEVRNTIENIGGYIHGERYYICPVCKQEVSGNVMYFDPYYNKARKLAAQVHYKCLSQERLDEIRAESK